MRETQAHLSLSDIEREILSHLHQLQQEQDELTDQIISALSSAVEAKDRYTNGHSRRVALYAQEIARRMGWDEERCRHVYYTGLLHDVGKLRIPDAIINKSSKLTDSEYEEMKLHTVSGYYILKGISAISDFAIGARWHHERYDGKGYPNGLSGENIPLISRIVGVADVYDALTSDRSYRDTLTQAEVRAEIERGLGTRFDPDIGRIMLQMIDEDKDYHMRQPDAVTERTILAIDDDPMVLKLLEFTFQKTGKYHILTAGSGAEGLEKFRENPVDMILLDMEMPQMNGFEVLASIRSMNQYLPVIFMTGEKDMNIILKAESMGISDYLTKPLVQHILLESVQNVLLSNTRGSAFPALKKGTEHER